MRLPRFEYRELLIIGKWYKERTIFIKKCFSESDRVYNTTTHHILHIKFHNTKDYT